MRAAVLMAALLVGVWVNPLTGGDAHAATISILDIGDSGTTADGTTFVADPNPSQPSTGTGVFQPFVRIQATGSRGGGLQNGFNTDAKEPEIATIVREPFIPTRCWIAPEMPTAM